MRLQPRNCETRRAAGGSAGQVHTELVVPQRPR